MILLKTKTNKKPKIIKHNIFNLKESEKKTNEFNC